MLASGTVAGSNKGAWTAPVSTSEISLARRIACILKPVESASRLAVGRRRKLTTLVVGIGKDEEYIAQHVEQVLLVERVCDIR
jgi:hypothetical protein